MNYGELKQQVADWAHRSDASYLAQMDNFKDAVEERLRERTGYQVVRLILNSDTNDVLTNNQLVYIYGMLEEGALYTQDGESAATYREKWNDTVNRLNITENATNWAGSTPPGKVAPYIPPEVG